MSIRDRLLGRSPGAVAGDADGVSASPPASKIALAAHRLVGALTASGGSNPMAMAMQSMIGPLAARLERTPPAELEPTIRMVAQTLLDAVDPAISATEFDAILAARFAPEPK